MPYAIRLPDGTLVQNIPDELDPAEAKRRIIAAGLIKAPAPETTFLGQAKEAVKGLIPGAVGLVEQAAIGASALLPEDYEKAAREKIASIAGAAKAPFAAAPGYEETVGRKIGEAVGSTAPFLAAGPLGLAGRVGAVGLGVGAGAGEARTRAEKEGATEEQRATATALGIAPGALEVFAPFRILSRIPEGEVLAAAQRVRRALIAGGEEAAQEAASGLAQNLIARGVYKPEQELIEGLGEQAAYGGAAGAIIQGLMDLAIGRRARGPAPAGEETAIERARREAEAAATAAEAAPPAEEPAVRKPGEPKPLPDTLDSETIRSIGFTRGKIRDALMGKAITDPEIRTVLEEYKQRPNANARTAAKIDAFLARLPEAVAPPVPTPAPPAPAPIPPVPTPAPPAPAPVEAAVPESTPVAPPPVAETPAAPPAEAPVGGAPTPEAPSVPTEPIEPEAGRTGPGVAGGPAAVSAAPRPGEAEPDGVVPPAADVGQPAGGEKAKPVAVKQRAAKVSFRTSDSGIVFNESVSGALRRVDADDDIALEFPAREGAIMLTGIDRQAGGQRGRASDVLKALTAWADQNNERLVLMPSASGDLKQPELIKWYERNGFVQAADGAMERAPKVTPAAEPEYTEEDIDRAVDLGVLSEEEADVYRAELRGEEAPSTAMGVAFEKQIADIKAQMDALRQKNGKPPAPKSKNRAKYDELQAQLDALTPKEEGDLIERLEKIGATGVVGTRGERPVIDLDAVRENLLKARAAPKMYEAVLTYIGVDKDGNYLPTTYSREEAAEMAGLSRSSGANVTRTAQALGITADVVSRFHAGQTDIIVRGKNVSEAGTGATDLQPTRGVLYEAPTKGKAGRAAGFLRGALTSDGKLDFSNVPLNSKKATKDSPAVTGLAEIYARASNYDPKRGNNEEVIKQLNAEIAARTKADRKGMQSALDRAYRVVRAEEEAAAEQAETDRLAEEGVDAEDVEAEDKTRRLSDEDVEYRSIPQTPVITNRVSHAELEKTVSDIEKALGGEVAVTILDDVTDVDNKQKPGSRAGATIKGGIYLFRSGIAKGIEGQKTIFHELFHKGLKNLLPEAEYRAMMNRFYSQSVEIRTMADAYLASDTGKKDTKNLSPQDARTLAVEESLAEIAEKTDLKPTLVRQVGNFLARVADRFGMPQLARAIRTMGLNEQQKFIRDALQAGMGPSKVSEGATRFRVRESETIKPIGRFGPIKNASIFYWSNEQGVSLQLFDQDLIDSGIKLSKAVVDQFDLDISKDGKIAEIHTYGVPPAASAVLSKYKDQISRVKPVGFSRDPYYKFDPGAFSNKEIRQLIRSLRDIAVREGSFDKVETVKIKRITGATAGRAPREISRETAMRFRTTPTDVIGERKRRTLTEKLGQDYKGNKALRIRQKFTDSMAPVDDLFTNAYGGKVRDRMGNLNPMVLLSRALDALRISKAVQEQGGLSKVDGLWVADKLVDADGREVSYVGVLSRIADAAKKAGRTYDAYAKELGTLLVAHREYNLREKNKTLDKGDQITLFFDDPTLDALEAQFQGDDFAKGVLKDLDTIRFNLLDALVASGRISEKQAQEYKDATGYVPFERIGEFENAFASTKGANRGVAALKKMRSLEGSKRQTVNPIENFSGLVDWATKETMKNEAAGRALDDMALLGAAKKVPSADAVAKDAEGAVVQVYKDGAPAFYYVLDPAHVPTFSMIDRKVPDTFKLMQKGSQILRAGVTGMPPFAVKQIFDDIVRAYTYGGVQNNAELVRRVLTNFPKNWFNEVFKRKTASAKKMESLGIVGTFDFSQTGNLRNIMEEAGAEQESLGRAILRVMEAGAKASDLAVRQAIYEQVMKETGDTVAAESAAREIINFSRRGTSETMNLLISVIPFFNAYARGMDKLAVAAAGNVVGKSVGTARAMFYKRMGVLTAMGFAYALAMQDDEEYQNLPDHVRDTNWVLPGGKYLGYTPVIPIPAELAFFFKAIPERVVQYMKYQGTDEERAMIDLLGQMALRGVDVFSSPNLTPQILRPMLENLVNYSFFLGRPLESQAQLALEPYLREGMGTSDAMKAVAKVVNDVAESTGVEALKISPIKLENLVRGMMGTGAGLALSMADAMVNPTRTDRPLHQQLTPQLTGASALMKDAVGMRFMDEIYKLERSTEQAYNSMNRLMKNKPEEVEAYVEQNKGMLGIRPAVKSVLESIRTLNEQARIIDKDTSLAPDERRKLVNELRAEQNEIAKIVYSLRKDARDIQLGL